MEYGCITTPAKEKLSLRLKKIYDDLDDVISKYNIDAAAVAQAVRKKLQEV